MPSEYYFDRDAQTLVTRMWGTICGSDVMRHIRSVVSDPNMKPTSRELVDLRDVRLGNGEPGPAEIITPGGRKKPNAARGKNRTAIVIARQGAREAAKMYENIAGSVGTLSRVEVFQSIKRAKAWLSGEDVKPKSAGKAGHGTRGSGRESRSRHH